MPDIAPLTPRFMDSPHGAHGTQRAGTAPQHFGYAGGMPDHPATGMARDAPLIYVGLSAIAKAVGAGPGTIKRWIRDEAFPARRCSDGIYRASASSMRQWFEPPFPGMPPRQAEAWASLARTRNQQIPDCRRPEGLPN